MNSSVNVGKLVQLFWDAPVCKPTEAVPYRGEVSKYLLDHYLAPFLNSEEPPTVGSLDFSAFTLEDAEELEEYLQNAGALSEKLIQIHTILNKARPKAGTHRAFC